MSSPSLPAAAALRAPRDLTLRSALHRHQGALLTRARRLTSDSATAWDLVQDTFERALRGRPAELPQEQARFWLLSIMQNLHIDRCRTAARRRQVELRDDMLVAPAEEPTPAPRWESIDAALVRDCVQHLDVHLRDAYLLRCEQRLPLVDVAKLLGVAPSTAGTRVFRARRRLRQLLVRAEPSVVCRA